MIEKVTKYIAVLVVLLCFPFLLFADGQAPSSTTKKGNFKKSSFSKENSWSRNGKALTPPDPNADGWGATAPISSGLMFLLVGSTLFILKRIKDEQE